MSDRRIYCASCDAQGEAGCDCGAGYISASAFAAKVLMRNPEKSNRALAAEFGLSNQTVMRARQNSAAPNGAAENAAGSAAPNGAPEKRVGLDGKTYSMPKQRPAIRRATPEERGDHSPTSDRHIDERTGENISRLEAIKRQTAFDARSDLEARIAELTAENAQLKYELNQRPAMDDLRRHDAVANHVQRITTDVDTYDLLRRCLHPDSRVSVSDEMLHKAWLAFRNMEPLTYDKSKLPPPLPSTLSDLFRMREEAKNKKKHRL